MEPPHAGRCTQGAAGLTEARDEGAPTVVIEATQGWGTLDPREMWQYRELLYFLTWRDIAVRYKQTALGVVWVLLQPTAMVALFALLFGRLAGLSSDGRPYVLFALAGILPWQLFSRTLTESTNSLVADQKLVTRVYFPRILVPTAAVVAGLFDFFIAMGLALIVFALSGASMGLPLLALPLFTAMLVVISLGVGYWLSALNLEYRDVSYAVPFLVQFWMFCTPIVYASSVVPARWRALYALNPLVGVIDGFRWSLLGTPFPSAGELAVSVSVAAALLVSGVAWFRRRERTFVDAVGSGGR